MATRASPMNPLDLGVIGIIALSAIFAFARGFVREALSIVAWVGAGAITLYGFTGVYAHVDPRVHDPLLSQLIAGFGLFVASLIGLTILTGLVAGAACGRAALSPIDRTLGFIFGVARGAFLVSLAYLLLDVTVCRRTIARSGCEDARSAAFLTAGADMLRRPLAGIAADQERRGHRRRGQGTRARRSKRSDAMRALANPVPRRPTQAPIGAGAKLQARRPARARPADRQRNGDFPLRRQRLAARATT